MAASQAQIDANRRNATLSSGPRTPAGKAISRANSFKHGLTGAGVVLPNEDAEQVNRRIEGFRDELKPNGEVGEALVRRAAILSVRLDRCVSQETAALAERVRQAEADFVPPAGLGAAEIEQLRAEAKARVMFDASKEATLARKYEAATERSMFRALKELREIQKQAKAAEPEFDPAELQELLASFSQGQKERDAYETHRVETDRRNLSNPSRRPESTPIPAPGAAFDVPFTIGQPR